VFGCFLFLHSFDKGLLAPVVCQVECWELGILVNSLSPYRIYTLVVKAPICQYVITIVLSTMKEKYAENI